MADLDRTLAALRELRSAVDQEASKVSDDFDFGIAKQAGEMAGRALYFLTRGGEGIQSRLGLDVIPAGDRALSGRTPLGKDLPPSR